MQLTPTSQFSGISRDTPPLWAVFPFLRNMKEALITDRVESRSIQIDRSRPFDPRFIYPPGGITIWKGPKDGGGLCGDEDQDPRAVTISSLDLSKVRLETGLSHEERQISGETRLARLKEKSLIRLDATVAMTLWKNPGLIPEQWKRTVLLHPLMIYFEGTIVRCWNGHRYSFCIFWNYIAESWCWRMCGLKHDLSFCQPSAVLEI